MCLGVVIGCLLFNSLGRWFARPSTAPDLPGGVQVVLKNPFHFGKRERQRPVVCKLIAFTTFRARSCVGVVAQDVRLTWITGFEAVASPRFDS